MKILFFEQARLPDGWARNVTIVLDGTLISSVTTGCPMPVGAEHHTVAIPGMPNLHSHAFQRGMAGLAERRGPASDNFWTWREQMYRFALTMTPDDLEAVAAQLYMEMLETGFTRVGEFHYLHHDIDGRPYNNIAEMAMRIAAACETSGIGLTLLPVYYAHSNFGGAPPMAGQRRFLNDLDGFGRLLHASQSVIRNLPHATIALAPHSLRAVTPDELRHVVALQPQGQFHIHAAEQIREVEECVAWSGRRPVQWLLDDMGADRRWCFIHATHMTKEETDAMAAAGVIAGLCPVTEANLGDGLFNGPEFVAAGGRFGIGSDSNVLIGVADELRQLEYAQRLRLRVRNAMTLQEGISTGAALFDAAWLGGTAALGIPATGLVAGAQADVVSLNMALPSLNGRQGDDILDAWIFTTRGNDIDCVWSNGRKVVVSGRHIHRTPIAERFQSTMKRLLN